MFKSLFSPQERLQPGGLREIWAGSDTGSYSWIVIYCLSIVAAPEMCKHSNTLLVGRFFIILLII